MTALRPNLPPSLQRVITRCLRKRAQDRYADAKELAGDLKTVQREIESGISSKAPLALKLQERWQSLRDRTLGEWLLPAVRDRGRAGRARLLLLRARAEPRTGLLLHRGGGALPLAPLPEPAACAWRAASCRRPRSIPEIRLITLDGMRFVALADRAQARTYVRANAALDSVNASMFFGEPFTLVIRDEFGARRGEGPARRPGRPLRARDRPAS